MGSKANARTTAFPHAPRHEELSSNHSCKLHVCSTVAENLSQETAKELRQLRLLERAAAKSVNRIPDSRGAHATCAKGIVSTSKISSVIYLDETHL